MVISSGGTPTFPPWLNKRSLGTACTMHTAHVHTLTHSMPFRLSQDPNSQHLGTTVWDASIVLAKYLELQAGKGEWSRAKLKTKRCIELGAGSGGLAGMVCCHPFTIL